MYIAVTTRIGIKVQAHKTFYVTVILKRITFILTPKVSSHVYIIGRH